MSYSISRLTLFAVICSIETDLRDIISNYLGLHDDLGNVLGNDIAQQVCDRYEKDFGHSPNPLTIDQVLFYIDFADSYKVINSNPYYVPNEISKIIKSVTASLENLAPIRNRVMHSRPLLFDDFPTALDIAEILSTGNRDIWKNLISTLDRLKKEPSFVLNLDIPTFTDEKRKHNLPIPDFDETGFLGRRKQSSDLLKQVLGPFPVVSLVGDGGIGKTALALKVAYDILDMDDCPFEAIVWTSSKTTQLTAQEIRRIEGAISDSLGIINSIAVELTGTTDNAMEEVIEYLGAFKILLIIDNLETVLDEKIRQFLERLPFGSKVLITSRIGIGSLEVLQKMQPMDQNDAIDLLRAIARVRGVTDLIRIDNSLLLNYCQRMKFSPGYIKWFVSAVQTGTRPEEVLSKPDLFLDFCMSNVYNYLSVQGKVILRSMLGLPGKHSLAELAFINEIEATALQPLIYELLRTNMVIMSSTAKGSSFESQYDISDLARSYLTRLYPLEPKEFGKLIKRRRQLVAADEEFQAANKSNPYSLHRLTIRSRSDVIVAKYLVDALKLAEEQNFQAAETNIQKARNLAPEYFEVHRVDAIAKTLQGNYSAAHSAYEAAIEIEPLSAPLRRWYGIFLMKYLDNTNASLIQFKKAAELDPDSIEVKVEIVRALLYLREYDEATQRIQELIGTVDLRSNSSVIIYDINLQCYYRKADFLVTEQKYAEAVEQLEKLKQAYESIPANIRDSHMREKIANAVQLARYCSQLSDIDDDTDSKARGQKLFEWFAGVVGISATLMNTGQVQIGSIKLLPVDKSFGFIQCKDGKEFFFHRNEMKNITDWPLLTIGMEVTFKTGLDRRGPSAIEIAIKDKILQTGVIARIRPDLEFGFIRASSGIEYFFHFNDIIGPESVKPQIGNKVRYAIGENSRGPCAIDVTIE